MATVATDHLLTIGGVKVQFPVKPYPSQLSMMDKVTHLHIELKVNPGKEIEWSRNTGYEV